jgi:hypothetical protein
MRLMRLLRSRRALWVAFVLVNGWVAFIGVGPANRTSFGDVDLYRKWAASGVLHGVWPGLDSSWVYPSGAWVPILVPAVVSVTSRVAYAIAWCAFVAMLNAVVVQALDRSRTTANAAQVAADDAGVVEAAKDPHLSGRIAAWGWLAFVLALGPVGMGRLDSVVAPMMVIALLAARLHPRVASALLTAGAWIKVAPGALLVAVATLARRPLRDVVLPAAIVSAVVVAVTAALGGLPYLTGFLSDQGGRGLQVEATLATPWVIAGLVARHAVHIVYNARLVTYEITGPGSATVSASLNGLLIFVVTGVSALLVWARRRGADVLLPGTLVLTATLIVTNKVGSPQYMTWLVPPIAVAIATRAPGPWLRLGELMLGTALVTQYIYPWNYGRLLRGDPLTSVLLGIRNVAVVIVLVVAIDIVVKTIRRSPVVSPPL